ncbi:MAG: hypothetical protein U5K30_11500 [Acidimicrobiales bacterium]|nr:hypothetical protein [Acidimicrobiales bacterium]
MLDRHDQLAVVPWQPVPPTGADALADLVGQTEAVVTADVA